MHVTQPIVTLETSVAVIMLSASPCYFTTAYLLLVLCSVKFVRQQLTLHLEVVERSLRKSSSKKFTGKGHFPNVNAKDK
jgi:hypothetical protein